jgi:hypothetical protein
MLQLGLPTHVGHHHLDAGTFQIWRSGRWLSKESTGYAQQFKGGSARHTIAHNGLVLNGIGLAEAYADGPPKVGRIRSAPDYFCASVDLSSAYRASRSKQPKRDDNPYARRVTREFLFIKPLETLVVLDLVEALGTKAATNNVVKTFLLHFPEKPSVVDTNHVVGTNGDQVLDVTTLLPATHDYVVVDEGDFQGKHLEPSYYQYRLEVNSKNENPTHFLHVLHARGNNDDRLKAELIPDDAGNKLILRHPTKGQAVILLTGKETTTISAIGYSAAGIPKPAAIPAGIQGLSVTDNGPSWK